MLTAETLDETDRDTMLAQVDEIVRRYCMSFIRRTGRAVEFEDMYQEMQISIMRLHDRFTGPTSAWIPFVASRLRYMAIDIVRRLGHTSKLGRRRWERATFADFDCDPSEFRPCHRNTMGDLEWSEFLTRCEGECLAVRALVYRCYGYSMPEIGAMLGVHGSRVSQLLSRHGVYHAMAVDRVKHLLGIGAVHGD